MTKFEIIDYLYEIHTHADYSIEDIADDLAVPVVHGKWQVNRLDDAYCICTICKKVTRIPRYVGGMLYAYCPHCGARMDGKGNGNEID